MFYPFLYLYVFWCLYIAIMGIYRAHLDKRLTGAAKWLAYPLVAIGLVIDVLANIFLATTVFLELPQEWLVTQRLSRLINSKASWRTTLADFICTRVLDPFDPTGKHCK